MKQQGERDQLLRDRNRETLSIPYASESFRKGGRNSRRRLVMDFETPVRSDENILRAGHQGFDPQGRWGDRRQKGFGANGEKHLPVHSPDGIIRMVEVSLHRWLIDDHGFSTQVERFGRFYRHKTALCNQMYKKQPV